VAVSEASGDAAVEFDEPVDRFGAAVGCAAGVEVGQERLPPLFDPSLIRLVRSCVLVDGVEGGSEVVG
jgi:hypothetical protein